MSIQRVYGLDKIQDLVITALKSWLVLLKFSIKVCDNLLVEADVFIHFRGLILCSARLLCPSVIISKLMELLVPFMPHIFIIAAAPL